MIVRVLSNDLTEYGSGKLRSGVKVYIYQYMEIRGKLVTGQIKLSAKKINYFHHKLRANHDTGLHEGFQSET